MHTMHIYRSVRVDTIGGLIILVTMNTTIYELDQSISLFLKEKANGLVYIWAYKDNKLRIAASSEKFIFII